LRHISERFVDHRFVALDRSNEVEFNRKWNISESAVANEEIQEFSMAYLPTRSGEQCSDLWWLNRSGESAFHKNTGRSRGCGFDLPNVQYQIEKSNTPTYSCQDESHWTRSSEGTLEYEIARWRPSNSHRKQKNVLRLPPTGFYPSGQFSLSRGLHEAYHS